MQVLKDSTDNMPYSEGLKPLKCFTSFDELLSMGGDSLLQDLLQRAQEMTHITDRAAPFLHPNGTCRSLNYHLQPLIGVIYGPTGCGKSQLLRNLISPKVNPSQLNRFINTYTKGLPTAISLLLKDILNFCRNHGQYDWLIYSTDPADECMQWSYLHPKEGLVPMYLNLQTLLYGALEKVHKTLRDRERWSRYYHSKRK